MQGEHEEQQLQLGFIAFLPSVMVGRRIAPDGRVMDPHPNGFGQHLINVRRIHKIPRRP